MSFVRALRLADIRDRGRALFRHEGRQIALFAASGAVHAVDNRCPHEGYPLLQGTVDEEVCRLTCQWHNWKFDLANGECLLGEDPVRSYRTRVENGYVEVDVTEPPIEEIASAVHRGLDRALEDRQYGRIAREVSRLLLHGLDPLLAVRRAVERTHDRFEFGTTHAYAALADWLALYEREDDVEARVVCLTEALDHIACDALRQPSYPFSSEARSFDPEAFLASIEAENEDIAVPLLRGALQDSLAWRELEPVFAEAALAHYNDFGHAAIYVVKMGTLLQKLAGLDPSSVLLPLTRMLCYSTREDRLPDFRAYIDAAAGSPRATGTGDAWLSGSSLSGQSLKETLSWTLAAISESTPEVVYSALLEAGAVNLLRFDESRALASPRSVSQNVSWLDFTHALTFGNAVRRLCERRPELWPRGLLQMACFVGRNKRFLVPEADFAPELVEDDEAFFQSVRRKVLDHGFGEPIYSAHLVKTMVAVEEEMPHVSEACARHLKAALNRFLSARIKEKHPLRAARQALALVSTP